MTHHGPKDPPYAERTARSFAKQALMETIGARILRIAPGEVDIELPVIAKLTQQHGFVHAGAVSAIGDTACGYAALTLMPPSAGVLTVEFKINLLASRRRAPRRRRPGRESRPHAYRRAGRGACRGLRRAKARGAPHCYDHDARGA